MVFLNSDIVGIISIQYSLCLYFISPRAQKTIIECFSRFLNVRHSCIHFIRKTRTNSTDVFDINLNFSIDNF